MSDKESRNHVITIVVIVALVVIVAVVMLGFNKSEFSDAPVAEGEESNFAGEAVRAVQQQNLMMVSNELIEQKYNALGLEDTYRRHSPSQVCQNLGYRGCFAGTIMVITNRHSSTD